MRLLLDTHAFLWFVMGDPRLSGSARASIEDPANVKLSSLASAWEIAIKASLGKLTLAEPFSTLLPREVRNNGFQWLRIDSAHLEPLATLPFHHTDPFDRLLLAQCIAEKLKFVTADTSLSSSPTQSRESGRGRGHVQAHKQYNPSSKT